MCSFMCLLFYSSVFTICLSVSPSVPPSWDPSSDVGKSKLLHLNLIPGQQQLLTQADQEPL